jgi:phosphatidylglycerophosphate synthase
MIRHVTAANPRKWSQICFRFNRTNLENYFIGYQVAVSSTLTKGLSTFTLSSYYGSIPFQNKFLPVSYYSHLRLYCQNIYRSSTRKRSRFLGRAHFSLTPEQKARNQRRAILSQLQSIPNMITTTRILFTPYLSYLILTDQYTLALYGCALAGFSDFVDGYIAKNYGGGTVLGTYLDPLADKILINTLALSLAFAQLHPGVLSMDPITMDSDTTIVMNETILPLWCVLTWLSRDVLLIYFSYRAAEIAAQGRDHNVADPSQTPLKVDPPGSVR